MKIKPIVININNNREYLQVVSFVDKDDFLKDIEIARKKLKIKIKSHDKAKRKWEAEDQKIINKYGLKFSSQRIRINFKRDIDEEVTKILTKYKKSSFFHSVVKFSIACNQINEDDLGLIIEPGHLTDHDGKSSCYVIYPTPEALRDSNFIDDYISLFPWETAIVITPETRREELLKAFNLIEKGIKKHDSTWKMNDIVSNIKRDRKWYFLKKEGFSYSKIVQISKGENIEITRDGVIKAIQQYKRLISM